MAIRIVNRATVSDAFKYRMIEIYKSRLTGIKNNIDSAYPGIKDNLKAKEMPKVNRLIALINDKSALDREITKLRSLPYTVFDFQTHGERSFMYGKTKEITIIANKANQYDAGEYGVYAPFDRMMKGNLGQNCWHFIPFRDPKSHQRTPHHHSGHSSYDHPLEANSATCWGSFGSVVPGILADGDVVELFRILHFYISRYDQNSPLGGIRPMKFVTQIFPQPQSRRQLWH